MDLQSQGLKKASLLFYRDRQQLNRRSFAFRRTSDDQFEKYRFRQGHSKVSENRDCQIGENCH